MHGGSSRWGGPRAITARYDPDAELATGPLHLLARSHDAISGVGHHQFEAYDLEWETWLAAVPGDGRHTLSVPGWHECRFRAVDRAGNWSAWTRTILIDIE